MLVTKKSNLEDILTSIIQNLNANLNKTLPMDAGVNKNYQKSKFQVFNQRSGIFTKKKGKSPETQHVKHDLRPFLGVNYNKMLNSFTVETITTVSTLQHLRSLQP